MDTVVFSCDVNILNPLEDKPINLKVTLNGDTKYKNDIFDSTHIELLVNDQDDTEQTIEFIITQKSDVHTELDYNGNIIKSTELIINNLNFDSVSIDNIIAVNPLPYFHDSNGALSEPTVNNFYNVAGCNGKITFKFTTPIYLWLLENM